MNIPAEIRLDAVNVASGLFDDIIDVRSPAEFAEDHLPGAINLPVLSDDERAQVGTIYKQVSPFYARKTGAALVAANAARHIAGPLKDRDGGWRPLVYCWRGGQRSGALATILGQVGWRVGRVSGGYKSWRRLVVRRVQELGFPARVIVLDGNTGSAKTEILLKLVGRGHQVIDLEGLANHRGSLFGSVGEQPGQKMFEGRLASQIEALDPERPVFVEAESSRIGSVTLPKAVWSDICAAPRIALRVPVQARAAYSSRHYQDVTADPQRLSEILDRLRPLHAAGRIAEWVQFAEARNWPELAEALMREHYDPRYEKHRARYAAQERAVIGLDSLRDLDEAAGRVEQAAAALPENSDGGPTLQA
ncbi:tRNA 2-selenouridine(34) synthase MnmH [Paracoccus aerodenitrificans]|uniref:tRNA 2-selenouridine(34) synthase MnmH n=1 Tax=Paracoccus aerodenitrificans TaxID=3017781 RepID=UPI0022F0A74E|nr:tRNA 2-selenouridine(34) synthase MnmH [Paracoccus aerodenitrificans]WBU63231.1 tRNA 2-selenouridine(34) synthase MnmH [Paracoccus aerodenitrificans]